MNIKDTLIASLVPIFLGFGFVIAKPAFESFPPILLMGLRFMFAASILIWWFPIPWGYLKKIFIASFIANTLQYSITYSGLDLIDASAAVLIVQTEVPFGVIFAYFMLKEKPTIRALIGISIAFIGVYILTGSPNLDGKFIGIGLTILGSATWALGQVIVKPLSKELNPLALVAWLALFSGPILIFLSAMIDGNTINYLKNAKFDHWIIAIYIGFIMQPITYGCFYYVLKNNPLYKVLPIVTMGIPPTGLLAAIFLLGENPTQELYTGGALIIVGVIFAYFMLKEKPTIRALIGISIAFIGVYILTGSPNLDGKFIGIGLTILGSATWALGQVIVKPLSKELNPLALVAWLALFSGPILIFLSVILDGNTVNYLTDAKFDHWMIAIYIGFIMQPITYGCFYYVLKNNPLYKVLPIVTMGIPPTGLLAAIFILGENPTQELYTGGALIIVGVILIVFTKNKKKEVKE